MAPEQRIPLSHRVLLLCDRWDSTAGGIANVNMTLALGLSKYRGIEVYSTIFGRLEDLTPYDRQLAERNQIRLISLAKCVDEDNENGDESNRGYRRSLYVHFNENPKSILAGLKPQVRTVSHIIGHAPITAAAAVRLRKSLYDASKVVLFYHVISAELEWLSSALPFVVPTDTEMVRLGEHADVVFSVTDKIYKFYTSKFCNRSDKNIDHRLYLPQCTAEVFNLERNLALSQLPKHLEGTLICDTTGGRSDVGALGDVGAEGVCSKIKDALGKPYGDQDYAKDVSQRRIVQQEIETIDGKRVIVRRPFRSDPEIEESHISSEHVTSKRDTHSASSVDKFRDKESRKTDVRHTARTESAESSKRKDERDVQGAEEMRYGLDDRRYGLASELDDRRYVPDVKHYGPVSGLDDRRYGPDDRRYGPASESDDMRYVPDDKYYGPVLGSDDRYYVSDNERFGPAPASKSDDRRYEPDDMHYGPVSDSDNMRYRSDDKRYGPVSELDDKPYGPVSESDERRHEPDDRRHEPVSELYDKRYAPILELGNISKSEFTDTYKKESEIQDKGVTSVTNGKEQPELGMEKTEARLQALPTSTSSDKITREIHDDEAALKNFADDSKQKIRPNEIAGKQDTSYFRQEETESGKEYRTESGSRMADALNQMGNETKRGANDDTSGDRPSKDAKERTVTIKRERADSDDSRTSGRMKHVSGELQTGFKYQVKEGETNLVKEVVEGTMQSEFTYKMSEGNTEEENVTGNLDTGVTYVIRDPITQEVVGSVEDKMRYTLGDKPERGIFGVSEENSGRKIDIELQSGSKNAQPESVIVNTNQSSNMRKSIINSEVNITNNNANTTNLSNSDDALVEKTNKVESKENLANELTTPGNIGTNDTVSIDDGDTVEIDNNDTANIDNNDIANKDKNDTANIDNHDAVNIDNNDRIGVVFTGLTLAENGGEAIKNEEGDKSDGMQMDTALIPEDDVGIENATVAKVVVENEETPPKELIPLMRVLVVCQRAAGEIGCADPNEDWHGIDIATIAVIKAAQAIPAGFKHTLAVGGITARHAPATRERIEKLLNGHENIELIVHDYDCPEDLLLDMVNYSICLVPSRCEAYGHAGLVAISSGIPTLITEESCLAPLIRRLTFQPEQFLVPVTPRTSAVRQDASTWRDRILELLNDPDGAMERAIQLRNAIRLDEETRETHDDFIWYCLGGIRLRHHAVKLEFLYDDDKDRTFSIIRLFNDFLLAALKYCWRQKHHPLWRREDRPPALVEMALSVKDLIETVIDSVEMYDRRIVSVDRETGSFVVYCPTLNALTDLWAMCDVINRKLEEKLFYAENSPMILQEFSLKSATVVTSISGPEYLIYKNEQIDKILVIENII